jgi:hypothetical protein
MILDDFHNVGHSVLVTLHGCTSQHSKLMKANQIRNSRGRDGIEQDPQISLWDF